MALPEVTSREQWLKARKRLLADEKELTEAGDWDRLPDRLGWQTSVAACTK